MTQTNIDLPLRWTMYLLFGQPLVTADDLQALIDYLALKNLSPAGFVSSGPQFTGDYFGILTDMTTCTFNVGM